MIASLKRLLIYLNQKTIQQNLCCFKVSQITQLSGVVEESPVSFILILRITRTVSHNTATHHALMLRLYYRSLEFPRF